MEGIILYFILAILYVAISSFLISRFVDMKGVKDFREEMNALQKEFWKATKEGNTKKMDELNKKQLEKTKEFPFLIKEQLKMSLISLTIFFLSLYLIDNFDVNKFDDIKLYLNASIPKEVVVKPGVHIASFEVLGKNLKYELSYNTEIEKNEINKDDININITLKKDENGIKAIFISNRDVILNDDNASRTEVLLNIAGYNLNLHGIFLFIVFVLLISLVKSLIAFLDNKK
jgi:hypothetical protein